MLLMALQLSTLLHGSGHMWSLKWLLVAVIEEVTFEQFSGLYIDYLIKTIASVSVALNILHDNAVSRLFSRKPPAP